MLVKGGWSVDDAIPDVWAVAMLMVTPALVREARFSFDAVKLPPGSNHQ